MYEEPVPPAETAADNNQILVAYRRHIMQLFRKLLIPEIFSEILRHLTAKDRLNVRLCCHDTEEAVARSDMHIEGTPQMISLSDVTNELKLHLGLKKYRTTLGKHFDYGDLEEVARVRERLFARVFTKYVEVNVKYVPFGLISRILEGCMFEEHLQRRPFTTKIICLKHEFSVFDYLNNLDSKRCEGVKLSLPTAFAYEEQLLGLKPLRVLEIRNIIESNAEQQLVRIEVWDTAVEHFLRPIGFRVTRDTGILGDAPFKHIFKMRSDEPEAEAQVEVKLKMRYGSDGKWTGDFDLDFGRVHIRANRGYSKYTFQISNYYRAKEKVEESSDDERTTYF